MAHGLKPSISPSDTARNGSETALPSIFPTMGRMNSVFCAVPPQAEPLSGSLHPFAAHSFTARRISSPISAV